MATMQQIADTISNKEFAQNLLIDFRQMNLDAGINAQQALWLHHRSRALEVSIGGQTMVVDVLNMAMVGDVEAAFVALSNCTPDDMSQPYHWFNAERVNWLKDKIAQQMGWA